MAFYVCRVPRITWAGPSSSDQQPKIANEEVAPISEGVKSSRVEVCTQYQEPSSIPDIKNN
eukprot:8777973-Ditylum_brightwellii.AAC.1